MEKKIQIKLPDGRDAAALIVDINQSSENWNQYLLEDGSVVKIKLVATKMLKVEGEFDAEGNPVYLVQSTNVLTVNSPDNLKKKIQ